MLSKFRAFFAIFILFTKLFVGQKIEWKIRQRNRYPKCFFERKLKKLGENVSNGSKVSKKNENFHFSMLFCIYCTVSRQFCVKYPKSSKTKSQLSRMLFWRKIWKFIFCTLCSYRLFSLCRISRKLQINKTLEFFETFDWISWKQLLYSFRAFWKISSTR